MLASFCSLTKRYLKWSHWKKQNNRLYTPAATKSKDIATKHLRCTHD